MGYSMKLIIAAVFVLAATLSGCSGEGETPTATATETVTVAPEVDVDDVFVEFIRAETDSFDLSPDSDILELAQTICTFWDNGGTAEEAFMVVSSAGIDMDDGAKFIGAATGAYCDEHSYLFEVPTNL